MVSHRQPSKNNKSSSLRYWWIPPEVQSFEPDNISISEDVHQQSSSHAKSSNVMEPNSPTSRVSTSQFVLAIVDIWGCVGQVGLENGEFCLKEDAICSSSVAGENFSSDFRSGRCLSSTRSNFEDLKTMKRMLCYSSCNKSIINCTFSSDSRSNGESSSIDKAYGCGSVITKTYFGLIDLARFNLNGCQKSDEISNIRNTNTFENNSTTKGDDSSSSNLIDNVMHSSDSTTTYPLQYQQTVASTKETIIVSTGPSSSLHFDYKTGVLTSADGVFGQCQESKDSRVVAVESSAEISTSKVQIINEESKSLIPEVVDYEGYSSKYWLSKQDKLLHTISRNKHALAGALAGTMVSFCLHPMDTVKTVVQANGTSQKSLYDIFKAIISERGILGLYRGIASNIASSAPISAIYTCTYESVKGALLPILPKEYHSLAHCTAGGCSSIATSFIFTPSERIKQQMQLGSQYQNCWNALIVCLRKGGVTSLYAGWGAVLCRNIPHSIIKFYTYESLKQLFLTSSKHNANPSTLQTLVCGGLAGSTAALFTTPFDVVKTRLQTQVPGSLSKYDGVLHALQEIAKREGLQGLYRGLIPRLAMYVSQGAIFFASYEFLKAVFSLGTPQAPLRVIKNEEDVGPTQSRLQTSG